MTPYPPALSETFIRGHAEGLPAEITLIQGWPPRVGDRRVLSLPERALHKAWRILSGRGIEGETTATYVKALRLCQADAVLAEYGTTGVLTMEACKKLQIPLIVHFHGFDASVREVLEENGLTYPLMFRQATAVIAVSRAMHLKLMSLGAPPEKVHYNPYGVDCDAFNGGVPEQAPAVFLAVGRFVEKKAPDLTLRAFAEVHRALPEATLRMVGDGPLLEECRRLAKDLAIEEVVSFLGAQPHRAVQEEMRLARCFVQHSVEAPSGDCEGTPVGILEAGATGLPVVATRHGGIPDVVVDGETGYLVEERDVQRMADRMRRLCSDPKHAGELGRAARQRIEAHFSKAASLGRLWAIIESCISPSHGHSADSSAQRDG